MADLIFGRTGQGEAFRLSGREEMLERIRRALGRARAGPGPTGERPLSQPFDLTGVMPPISPGELLAKFEAELATVAGTAHRVETRQALDGILRQILANAQASGVVLSRNPLLAQLGLAQRIRAWGKPVTTWPSLLAVDADRDEDFRRQAFAAAVGITGVDFALAETGSLVLTSVTEGSQLASLAPPVHVALYRRSQLLGSLDEVLARLPVARDPDQPMPGRSVVFVTGPSRTADIEQILIRGVHGPREVHAVLVEDSCLI